MKNLLLMIAIVCFGVFSSCDKCKKADCQNGATCEKKVGDCECANFYEGEKCEDEIRKKYVGAYFGDVSISILGRTESSKDTLGIILNGSNPNALQGSEGKLILTLTDNTNFTLSGSNVDSNVTLTFSGSGSFTSNSILVNNAPITATANGFSAHGTMSISATKL